VTASLNAQGWSCAELFGTAVLKESTKEMWKQTEQFELVRKPQNGK